MWYIRKEMQGQGGSFVEEQEVDYKKTILIVDDEKMILNLLSCNLIKEGYNVIEAKDGIEAINLAQEKKPNLILLDVMLPKLDGLSVCKRIKNMMNVPILMVTAKDDELDKILGLELGADDYITKPFSIRELLARVKANLRKADVMTSLPKEEIDEKNEDVSQKMNEKASDRIIDLNRTNILKIGVLNNLEEKGITREFLFITLKGLKARYDRYSIVDVYSRDDIFINEILDEFDKIVNGDKNVNN